MRNTYGSKIYFKKSIEYAKKTPYSYLFFDTVTSLAHLYYVLGDYISARSILQSDHLQNSNKEDKNPGIMRRRFRIMHIIERELGTYKSSFDNINRAIENLEKTGKSDERYASDLMVKGMLTAEMGNYDEAKNLTDDALQIYKKNDSSSFYYWKELSYYGGVTRLFGDYPKALKTLLECKDFFDKNDPKNALDLGFINAQIAKVYRCQGYLEKAEEHIKKAKKLYIEVFGENSLRTEWVNMTLGQILNDKENYDKAISLFENCLSEHLKQLKCTHPKIGKIKAELGLAYLKKGEKEKGQKLIDDALTVYENHYGKDHIRTAYILRMKSDFYFMNNQQDKALECAQKSLHIAETFNHPDVVLSLEKIGKCQLKMKDPTGTNTLKQALQKSTTVFGEDSTHTKNIKALLDG